MLMFREDNKQYDGWTSYVVSYFVFVFVRDMQIELIHIQNMGSSVAIIIYLPKYYQYYYNFEVAVSFSKLTPPTGVQRGYDLYRVCLIWLAMTSWQIFPKAFWLHDNAKHNAQKISGRCLMTQSFNITLHMDELLDYLPVYLI